MANLGFVGLGTMGGRIVARLLAGGHSVAGHNRTRAKAEPLIGAGMRWRDTPREAAEGADIVLSMVNDTASLEAVTGGPDGIVAGLAPGTVYIDMTTVSPEFTRRLAQAVREKGAEFLEAPVSGSVGAVETGALVFFVGGEAAALERARPILEALGQKIVYMGAHGRAVAMKIAINLNLGAQLIALSECVLLAERAGIERDSALDAFLNSVAASPFLKYKAQAIRALPEEAWFTLKMYQKDLLLALEMGRASGVPLFSAAVSNELATVGRNMGLGDKDFAAYSRVLERLAAKPQA